MLIADRFCKYDYGSRVNSQVYNSPQPPDYNLERITAPVYLHYSSNDWMSDGTVGYILISKIKMDLRMIGEIKFRKLQLKEK